MLRPYEYLFYRIYRCQLFVWGGADSAQGSAVVAMSVLLFVNIYTVGNLILQVLGIANFTSVGWTTTDALFIYFGLLAVNYFLLVRSKKISSLKKQFRDESQSVRRRNSIICLLYCVITPLAFFATLLPR
jgi:hypothetical protein